MQMSSPNESRRPPARRGLPLGWRLVVWTAFIIVVVMGGISVSQQLLSLKTEEATYRKLLQNSLAPLVARLENARTRQEIRDLIMEFHDAHRGMGAPEHNAVLADSSDLRVLSTQAAGSPPKAGGVFSASLPFSSPLITGGRGTITVLMSNEKYRAGVRREWLLWLVHLVFTIVIVSLFLGIATYFLFTRPVNRLIRGVRKMERGYWSMVDPGGAWEIRWLAWRFGNMAKEVRNSANRLSRAESKAWSLISRQPKGNNSLASPFSAFAEDRGAESVDSQVYERLEALCKKLEVAPPRDPEAEALARAVPESHAVEAGRFGFYELKARMEDAALRITEPESFQILSGRLDELRAKWGRWAGRQRSVILEALERRGIPCDRIL